MNEYHAREIVGRIGCVPARITWDASDEEGDFPPNELNDMPGIVAVATDDEGNVVPIIRWMNGAPEAPGASWVFYFDE